MRTEATKVLLQGIDGVLGQWQKLDFSRCLDAAGLEQVVLDTARSRKQFDSKLFFVVIFGPLKSGKSTLTNALAGEIVSPAGFGKETTRRPSLVIQAEQSGIDQYFSTDSDINDLLSRIENNPGTAGEKPKEPVPDEQTDKAHNAFDGVADFIRGVRGRDELRGLVEVVSHPLNEENLDRMLVEVEGSPRVPLLTVIRCRGGDFLGPGVAIVDMPGLDGHSSNWRENPVHEWVVGRAEFFFFVQSSVATFNRETVAFLRDVVGQAKKPPVWAIQNVFDAQHWQPEEKRKMLEEAQREEGIKRIRSLLKGESRGVVPLNLGLAWDGKCEQSDAWLQKSKFPDFEKDLGEVLRSERALIQEHVCLEKVQEAWFDAAGRLSQSKEAMEKFRGEHKRVRDKLRVAREFLDSMDYRTGWESPVQGEVATIAETTAKPWLDSLANKITKLKGQLNREKAGQEVNVELASAATALAAEGGVRHFARPPMLPQYVGLANQYCRSAESEAVAGCNRLLGELEKPPLPEAVAPSADDLPAVQTGALTNDQLPEKKSFFGLKTWIDKTHGGSTIHTHIDHVAFDWKQQIDARKDAWKQQLLHDHFSTYCEKRRDYFRAHLNRLKADFEAEAKRKEDAATATENLIREMNEALGSLELPLANAITSMNQNHRCP